MPGLKAPYAPSIDRDKHCIDALTTEFLGLFSPTPGATVSLQRIHDLFIPQGIIVRTCGPNTEVFSISEFITPRELWLNDGTLMDLCEREEWETTEIFGNVAQRFLAYRKTGVLHGERFDTRGMNTIQFVRKDGDWKMSALAWDDERNGLDIPARCHAQPENGIAGV